MTASPFDRNCDNPKDRPLALTLGGAISQGPSGLQARPEHGSVQFLPTLAQFVPTGSASELTTSWKSYTVELRVERMREAVGLWGDSRVQSPIRALSAEL